MLKHQSLLQSKSMFDAIKKRFPKELDCANFRFVRDLMAAKLLILENDLCATLRQVCIETSGSILLTAIESELRVAEGSERIFGEVFYEVANVS